MGRPELATIRIEHEDGDAVAALVLDRPDRLNALSRTLLAELVAACRWLATAEDVKVVVVRGSGRAFSGGFDLADMSDAGGASPRAAADLGRAATEALTGVPQITIAAIHGHCVGGGVVLAAACDLRLAAEGTTFSIPEIDLGIPLTWGGIPRLVRELGPAVTKELVLTCRPFDAAEARSLRFVNRVVPADELVAAAGSLARELAAKPSFGLRATKSNVNAVTDEMAGVGRSANDADTLVAALADPESRDAARAYLHARGAS